MTNQLALRAVQSIKALRVASRNLATPALTT